MQPRKLNQRIINTTKICDTVNCTSTSSSQSSSQSSISSLAYCLPVTVQRTVLPGYLQKKSMDAWYLLWQMTRNDSSIFLNSNDVSVTKITWYPASMHTTVSPTAASQNAIAFIRESLLVLRDHCIETFHKQKIFVRFKISWGQPSTKIRSLENLFHEIFLPWKFPRLRYNHITYVLQTFSLNLNAFWLIHISIAISQSCTV